MKTLMREFVSRVEEACGGKGEFVILLRHGRRDEAVRRILSKCRVKRKVSGVMVMGEWGGREFSLFATGKLLLKGFKSREEAEEFLIKLLS